MQRNRNILAYKSLDQIDTYELGSPDPCLALLMVWVEIGLMDWVLIYIMFGWIQMVCIS